MGVHRWLRAIGVTTLALAVAAGAGIVSPPAAHAAEAPYTHAIFNDPTGDDAAKNRIYTRLLELIEGAPEGSTIRMAMYYADAVTIPNALVTAKQRGVNVQVIMDEAIKTHTTAYDLLRTGLGVDTSQGSFFMTCPADRGCIANQGTWSIMHAKFFLFSSTLGAKNVVVQTSTNLGGTGWRDGGKGWNDALEVTGNDALFASYTGYFADLKAHKANNNYYDTRVPLQAGAAKVFYYPRAGDSISGDPAENTVMTILNNTDCFGNTTVGTSENHRTIIRVTTMAINLQYLAEKLVALDAAGCYVLVNVRVDATDSAEVSAVNALLKKTSSVYNGVVVRYYCESDPIWIHSKNFSIEGKYYDKPDRKIVWTGSLNWKGGSLRGSDEVMLQLENSTVFDAYKAQYKSVAAAATHQPANGDSVAC
ncbi:phospholipase D-like domain-containing protein [Dactylosporangium salmoneum]|uniref:phospholipase D n=1 Tax=Dactylosporangium salmoneum TaxID=53361 RepID=A0ABN3GSF3_9ACTN